MVDNLLNWRPFFPLPSPRAEQVTALDFIVQQIVNGKQYIIAELGTGVGKSAIAITLGRWFSANADQLTHEEIIDDESRGTYVLTSQKTLQDQYVREFKSFVNDLRSSGNFQCSWIKQSCGETMRLKRAFEGKSCLSNVTCTGQCKFETSKAAFKSGSIGISNYSYMLSEATYAGGLKPRALLVCDEAHNIESEVRRWGTITIGQNFVERELKLKIPTGNDDVVFAWIRDVYAPATSKYISQILAKLQNALSIKKTNMIQRLSAQYSDLDKHICQVHRFTNPQGGATQDDYMILRETDKGKTTISLKPLRIDAQAQSILYSRAKIRVLMSATILDKDVFAESVGISKDERAQTAFISIPTPFKHSSFGLVFKPIGKMSKNKIDANMPGMIEEIKRILAEHPTEKGIIHTSTYAITKALEQVKDPRLLIQRSADDRERMLDVHVSSKKPTVLVSPAMMEGLDLVDDLGRFQVICKVPYPYIGDPVVSKKMRVNPKWYAWCTVRTIVQASGRCVRSSNDWSRTYILDECFGDLITRWHTMFPIHFDELEVR